MKGHIKIWIQCIDYITNQMYKDGRTYFRDTIS